MLMNEVKNMESLNLEPVLNALKIWMVHNKFTSGHFLENTSVKY